MTDEHLGAQVEYWNNMARCVADEVAVNHWVDEQNRPVDKGLFSEVADYLVAGFLKGKTRGSVLEIGCGNGLILKELSERLPHEWNLYGCDISQEMLNKAVLKEATYVCSDARNIPLDGNKFDLVYLHSVTQYFDNEEYLRAVIDESMRLLKGGGGAVPNGRSCYMVC
jgi:ubiquinone/menaquinone biosynthesis C-methylase UbiE